MEEQHSVVENSKKPKKQTIYNKLGIPNTIQIGDKTYVFKEELKSIKNTLTYRCKKFSCRIPITINRENLKNYKILIIEMKLYILLKSLINVQIKMK